MSMTFPYQAIIFDLDGTLIDSSPSILQCFGAVLAEVGLQPLVPLTDTLIGPPLRQTLINLTGTTNNDLLDQLVDRFKARYDTAGYRETKAYAGVDSLLARLAESGIPVAIATNKRRIPTLKIIEYFGWQRFFSLVGTLDTPTPPHANKAALIKSQLAELGVNSGSSLYVGDKLEDGEAALSNDMPFCAAAWGYGQWEKRTMPSDWHYAESTFELAKFF